MIKNALEQSFMYTEFIEKLKKAKLSTGTIRLYSDIVQKFLKSNPDINSIEDYNKFIIEYHHRKNDSTKKMRNSPATYYALKKFIELTITDGKDSMISKLIKAKQKPKSRYVGKEKITKKQMDMIIDRFIAMKEKYLFESRDKYDIDKAKQAYQNYIQYYKFEIVTKLLKELGCRVGGLFNLLKTNVIIKRTNMTGENIREVMDYKEQIRQADKQEDIKLVYQLRVEKLINDYNSEMENQGKVRMNIVYYGKGDKLITEHIVNPTLIAELLIYMEKHNSNTDYVFTDYIYNKRIARSENDKDYITKRSNYLYYWNALKEILIDLEIDIDSFAPHEFRREFAKDIWEWSHDPTVLQKAMNHSDVRTSMIYLNNENYDHEKIIEDFKSA